jgi:hypothetical protein
MDFEFFSKTFADDGKYLTNKGIREFEIALMSDYIKLTA